MLINSKEQAKRIGRPTLGGYIEQTGPQPAGGTPELVPEPDHDSIGPHMAYAVQWWLFAAAVPVGWTILVRRERQDRAEAAAKEAREAAEPRETGEDGNGEDGRTEDSDEPTEAAETAETPETAPTGEEPAPARG